MKAAVSWTPRQRFHRQFCVDIFTSDGAVVGLLDDIGVDEELRPDVVDWWKDDVPGVLTVHHRDGESVVELPLVEVLASPSCSLQKEKEEKHVNHVVS